MQRRKASSSCKRDSISTSCATLMIVLTVCAGTLGQTGASSAPDDFLGIATFPLWEGGAPGALGNAADDVPTITIFRPHAGTGNGTAVIVAPGGAYLGLAGNLEGRQVADWFTSRG